MNVSGIHLPTILVAVALAIAALWLIQRLGFLR